MSEKCNDCFTRIEFNEHTLNINFDYVESVLKSPKTSICMFMVDDYVFEYVDYVKDEDENKEWVVGNYITPIPHLNFMIDDEIWFKLSKDTVHKFTFFEKNEMVITIHGMLFSNGKFKDNLVNRFTLDEIRDISNDVQRHVMKFCENKKKTILVWNSFKCIGVQE